MNYTHARWGYPCARRVLIEQAGHIGRRHRAEFERAEPHQPQPVISSSNGTTAACENTHGGVPGIVAAATGATGELALA